MCGGRHSRQCGMLAGILIGSMVGACCSADEALPAANWLVKAPEGCAASLTENDGVLEISYRAKTEQTFQSGHITYRQALIQILLKEPVPIATGMRRVAFEAYGVDERKAGGGKTLLMPLIRDEKGEVLAYSPHRQPHLKSGTAKWSGWFSRDFYSSEAGGASQDVSTPLTSDGNAWPDGQLVFLGFALAERCDKPEERTGRVQLANWELRQLDIPAHDPYLYADALLAKAGNYRLGMQINRDFQGAPVHESSQLISFEPSRPSSARQKITFTLGSDGNYWIRYTVTGEDGTLVATEQLRAWMEGRPDAPASRPVDVRQPPSTGCLRINPEQASRGVYERGEELKIVIRAFPLNNRPCTLKWQLRECAYPQATQEGEETLAFNGDTSRDLSLALRLPAGQDAARLTVEARQEGRLIDRQEYFIGRRTDLSHSYTGRDGKRITRDEIKKSAYFRVSYLPYQDNRAKPFTSSAEHVAHFHDALTQISQLTTNVTVMIDLASFSVLPGVYNFDLLDQLLDTAYDQNCRVTIRLSHADSSGLYNWQHYWPQRNYDGSSDLGHGYYGNFSLSCRPYVDRFLEGFAALHTRYQKHPAFQGYQIFEIAGEWAVLDQPWAGGIVGYEKAAQDQFRGWTREHISGDLTELNKRWGTSFANWNAVAPPQPRLEDGAKPDLRLWWVDFCRFKRFLNKGYWFQTVADSIRSHDKDSVLIVYSLDPDGFAGSTFLPAIDYLHNGGNHFLRGEGSLIDAWKNGTGWITEPHHPHRWAAYGDKGDRGWLLDWTTYVMLAQAGGGGANLHVYYWPLPGKENLILPAHYGRELAYDRFEKFKPILRELHGLRLDQPKCEVAAMQDIYTLFCKHRTVFHQRLDDLKRWFELLKNDAVDYENYRPEHAADYKLLLPNLLDEVMSGANITLVGDAVRAGAKTVIAATTGRHCPERPDVDFALLKELGVTPPERPYDTSASAVTAAVSGANPFFTPETRIGFYSLRDMQNYLSGAEVGKTFQQWPYRWIPQTNYFGFFPGHANPNGEVIARFTDGVAAVSLHQCGKGQVLVFWGTPDYSSESLKGFMAKVCAWAGVKTPRASNAVPLTLEGNHAELNRHYAIMYQDKPGAYSQKLPAVPEGEFFIDELVSGDRLGIYQSSELRGGLPLKWEAGASPLKILRMIPKKEMGSRWSELYRLPPQ